MQLRSPWILIAAVLLASFLVWGLSYTPRLIQTTDIWPFRRAAVEASSSSQALSLEVVDEEGLIGMAREFDVFDRGGFQFPGLEEAYTIRQIALVVGDEKDYAVEESMDFVTQPQGYIELRIGDDPHTLMIYLHLHPRSLTEGRYSDEELSAWAYAKIAQFLATASGRYSRDALVALFDRYQQPGAPVPIQLKRLL